ncbi:MAG TPA: hypothetical protein VMY35_08530 [Phycisphaerae bacterium]|nr:hypothetical protein [Phycisphaerae bacterium]
MAKTTIGKLLVTLGGDSKGFGKMINNAERTLAGFQKGVHETGKWVEGLGKGMLVGSDAVQAVLTGMSVGFARWADNIAKAAKRMSVSTEWLSAMGHVAGLAGGDMETLEKGVKRMSKTISDANDGMATYVRSFDKLGLHAEDLINLSPEKEFMRIADAIGKMKNPILQAAVAQDMFGQAGTRLLPMIQQGAEGMHHYMKEAERLGLVLRGKDAVAAENLVDMLTRMKGAWQGIVNVVGVTVAPVLGKVATWITNITVAVRRWLDVHPGFIDGLMKLAKWAAVAGVALVVLGKGIQVLSGLLSPGGLFVVAVAGCIAWSGALDGVISRFGKLVGDIRVGGRTIAEWARTVGETWAALVPTFRAIGDGILSTFGWLWENIKYGFNKVWSDVAFGMGVMIDNLGAKLLEGMNWADPIGNKIKLELSNALRGVGGAFMESGAKAEAGLFGGKESIGAAADAMKDSWAKVPGVVRRSFADIADIGGKALADIKASEGGQFMMNLLDKVNRDFDEFDANVRKRIGDIQDATGGRLTGQAARPAAIERGSAASYSIAAGATYGPRIWEKTAGHTRRTAAATERMVKGQNDTNTKLDALVAGQAVVVAI